MHNIYDFIHFYLCWSKTIFVIFLLLTYRLADVHVSAMLTFEKFYCLHPLNNLWRMNQHQNYGSHIHQYHIQSCQCNGIKKTIKSFKEVEYSCSLSCLSCCANWLICTIYIERQSSSNRMEAHVERWNGITIKSGKTPDINVYTSFMVKKA